MNEIKLVHGAVRNRKFATPTKQAELKQLDEQRKQERADHLVNEWFTVDESEKVSISDICMSIGFYIGLPLMVVASFIGAILV